MGHHIRQTIVDQAREKLGHDQSGAVDAAPGLPEPIPERQEDINKQADAAIRDLFPRIPNTDRQVIIEHAFNKVRALSTPMPSGHGLSAHHLTSNLQSNPGGKDGPPVGLASHMNLSRRVQLAVLAHIRHTHTRYDQLLKETTYVNARKAVESLCLDVLVKWRGDEETGRDQLEEILCEVIVISDSESDGSDDDEDEDEDDSSVSSSADDAPAGRAVGENGPANALALPVNSPSASPLATHKLRGGRPLRPSREGQAKVKKAADADRRAAKWSQRGFSRYQAAWSDAVRRLRHENDGLVQPAGPSRPDSGPVVARSPAEPPYHLQRPHGAGLPSVDVSREGASRVNEQMIRPAIYHVPQPTYAQEDPSNNGFRPIVDPRAVAEVERVSYHGQDLKDYLVQSIEPASPRSSDFTPRIPVSHHQPERGLPHGTDSAVRDATRFRAPTARAAGEITAAQDLHPSFAEEGFIRLPPRAHPNRLPILPDHRSEPFILLNPLPVTVAGGSIVAAASDGLGSRQSSTWHGDAVARRRDPDPRPEARSPWIGHDGALPRSESRPIVIQDYPPPPRPPQMESQYPSLETRRLTPTRWVDARHIGPVEVDERDRRHADSRIDQQPLQDDCVEIIRVSRKFPRQYEPRPVSAGAGRYNLRSAASQHRVSQHANGGVARYDTQPFPQGQRFERVVGRVEVPVFPDENGVVVTRPPDGYVRNERVAGLEYIHPHPRYEHPGLPIRPPYLRSYSLDSRTYSDRGPFYDSHGPVHRSRSNSVVPIPHPGLPYHQPHSGRPTPLRDEVVILD